MALPAIGSIKNYYHYTEIEGPAQIKGFKHSPLALEVGMLRGELPVDEAAKVK